MSNFNDYATMLALLLIIGAVLFLVFTIFRSKQQTEIRKALIEKFGSAQDLGELLQTTGGKRLLADLSSGGGSPLQSVLSSIHKGLLALLVGLGALFVGALEDLGAAMFLGAIFACAGLAFLISAAVTYWLSKSWGLIQKKARLVTDANVMQAAAMEHVASGDVEALSCEQFEVFYTRTAPALRAYIRRVLGNPAAADDLLQEAYVRLLNAPPLTEPQRKSYLYRTATNLVTDHHRAQSRQRRWWERFPLRAEAIESRPELPPDMERPFLLIAAQERALLWLAYVEGEEHRAIAAVLGLREKSVRVLLHRARVKMGKILKEHGFAESGQ